jgi:hypothetical protein
MKIFAVIMQTNETQIMEKFWLPRRAAALCLLVLILETGVRIRAQEKAVI